MDIKDKVFLITGGASGLGAAAAEGLLAAGARVLLADINAEALDERVRALGAHARGVVTDVCDAAAAQAAVNAAREHFGALHGLVNCAGVASGERILGRLARHRAVLAHQQVAAAQLAQIDLRQARQRMVRMHDQHHRRRGQADARKAVVFHRVRRHRRVDPVLEQCLQHLL